MHIRYRKLIGTFALFALVIVWALVAMAIAQFPPIFGNRLIAGLYYVVAGIGWVLPAMPLVKWMTRDAVRPR
jgi:predicted transporter